LKTSDSGDPTNPRIERKWNILYMRKKGSKTTSR